MILPKIYEDAISCFCPRTAKMMKLSINNYLTTGIIKISSRICAAPKAVLMLIFHVSIIMMSFALLSITFICGITALMIHALNPNTELPASLQLLSQLFLYPALAALGIGIFIGAIWANISWGQYWSWDPKEVWALITLMCYAVAIHTRILPALRKPLVYHLYVSLAFLTILMIIPISEKIFNV